MSAIRPAASILALFALAAAMPSARADGVRAEVTPFVGQRVSGGFDAEAPDGTATRGVDVEDGVSWGVGLGLYATPDTFYEFLYATQTAGLDSRDAALANVDVTIEYYQFGGTAFFPGEQWPVPWLSMTIGATRFSADGGHGSDTKLSASVGTGLRLPFDDDLAVTLGLRGYLTLLESDTEFLCRSDDGDASCLVHTSGSTFFQAEAILGLTLRF